MRLIDADELIKKYGEYYTEEGTEEGFIGVVKDLIENELKANSSNAVIATPVDAEIVKHGRWIGYPECLRYENAIDDSYIVCSVCKEPFNIIDNDTERFDYCPHCGAYMGGEEE